MELSGKIADEGFRSVSRRHYMEGHHGIPRIWVVVADRHNVRIFTKPDGHIEQIGVAVPSNIGRTKVIQNDSLGRVVSFASGSVHHKYVPRMTPEEKEAHVFAREISEWLEDAVREDAFDRLILAAAPHMLGELRKLISNAVQIRIVAEVNKDLTNMDERELYRELDKIVFY